jgi:hypothetical protein
MRKYIYLDREGRVRTASAGGDRELTPFPVCLAVKYGNQTAGSCPDFMLDIDGMRIIVLTRNPLPEGAAVRMHFYIPPENMLLAEITGRVQLRWEDGQDHMTGMVIQLPFAANGELKLFESYIQGWSKLIDKQA